MSDEMAVGDNASNDEQKLDGGETETETMETADASELQAEPSALESEATSEPTEDESAVETKDELKDNLHETDLPIKEESETEETMEEQKEPDEEVTRGIKRRASAAFSDGGDEEFKGFDSCEQSSIADYSRIIEEERKVKRRTSTSSDDGFKGFDLTEHNSLTGYCQVLERLEAEVSAAIKTYTPVRSVMATPAIRASKRARQDTGGCTKWSEHLEAEVTAFVRSFSDENGETVAAKRQRRGTDSSRPSSALSSRSDGEGAGSTDASMSPAARGGRRATAEMSAPALRVPLERGWRRELVYRAVGASADASSRRNADIYYYTPHGKKLRSTREVAEHLSGTGLTLENFSFFKEPLGIDDPEKEIIRDAKVIRRVESPVPAAPPPVLDGKRTPKPKPPKGASPEPATHKSPPAKLKVKSMGSRLSSNGTTTPKQVKKAPAPQQQPQAQPQQQMPAPADNNNTAAWKKPRGPLPLQPQPRPVQPVQPVQPAHPAPTAHTTHAAHPTHSAHTAHPAHVPHSPAAQASEREPVPVHHHQVPRQVQQPCSMACGRGAVPSLACAACLCLYHPACVGCAHAAPDRFLCKNCRKSTSPPLEPPVVHNKTGVTTSVTHPQLITALPNMSNTGARRLPVPVPTKVPKNDKRVLLRMKVAGGGPDGERVWAVAKGAPPRPALPQSLAVLNGRRFIVVARASPHCEAPKALRARALANGAASPPAAPAPPAQSPRRRGRPRVDDADHFTAFHTRARAADYNVAVQIFQYLGMRDVARCARVCRLWRQLASAPALWRHVRMKNSHVSDWGGLCAALKSHGTRWLDLRKMLLPPNDTVFWDHFAEHIGSVDTLERLELCRCPARAVEAACERLPGLRALAAPAIRDARLDPAPLARLPRLELLRLKSLTGLSLTRDLHSLSSLSRLQHLSLTSIKELGWCACEVVGQLEQLESLELGECSFGGSFATALGKLVKLRRLRLERGVSHCAAPALLRALSALPKLTRLELVNFDVKVGFDDALAECKNIQRLLIIPTYVSQSATTNKQVLSGVLRLKDTLTHLMWGVTIELLRVTELFIDQCEAGEGEGKRRDVGECIPVLKPVPGCRLPDDHRTVVGPPQVEILPIPTLQRLLSAQLPNTKLKLLRIPFHATWRQSLADFQ
ncbi:uncharacterized protein LOC113396478 [Vanessa tameamea]|uniref:Uncharacterized protein LOC113396478 n=1 Tax=Vanessa tameamea TaxID=334116 RepID=A0ABM4AUU7_VANTA